MSSFIKRASRDVNLANGLAMLVLFSRSGNYTFVTQVARKPRSTSEWIVFATFLRGVIKTPGPRGSSIRTGVDVFARGALVFSSEYASQPALVV